MIKRDFGRTFHSDKIILSEQIIIYAILEMIHSHRAFFGRVTPSKRINKIKLIN